MSKGRFEKPKVKRKKNGVKIALIILCVLVVLLLAALGGAYLWYRDMVKSLNYVQMPPDTEPFVTETQPPETEVPETEPTETEVPETTEEPERAVRPEDIINVLLVGQQAREGEEAMLADTVILVSLNTYTKTVTLTSFFRDTLVNTPAYRNHDPGRTKLNMAYAVSYTWGGSAVAMDYMNRTLEQNFGVEVDYDVEIGFSAFKKLINKMGGLKIELNQAEADYLNLPKYICNTNQEVTVGMNTLRGATALEYVRMRKAAGDNESDIVRTERQRKVIKALVDQIREMSLGEIQAIIKEVLPLITTNMDPDTITELTLKVVPMLPKLQIETGVCPHEYWGDLVDLFNNGVPLSILEFNPATEKKYMRAITEGEIAE